MRVFLDTNVLVAAIGTRGLCSELFEAIIQDHQLLTCNQVLLELERVLAEKLCLSSALIGNLVGLLRSEAEIVNSQRLISVQVKNRDDIPILSCAIEAAADVFVTGDKELLDLGHLQHIAIVSPRDLWNRLAGLSPD